MKEISNSTEVKEYTATRNACKLCTPLGASVVFKGIEKCVPLLHGSQGCSTYIRRYMISHYKEPVDIASTNFGEMTTIFGGKYNLSLALDNVIEGYHPAMIGIATTCLSETIGDDVDMFLYEYRQEHKSEPLPYLVPVSTPSYQGTHMEGFHKAVHAIVKTMAENTTENNEVALMPGILSTEDLRHLKFIFREFGTGLCLLPDYSEALDGTSWKSYNKIPPGGTPISGIKALGAAKASVELGDILLKTETAGGYLNKQFQVPNYRCSIPIGIRNTDTFMEIMKVLSSNEMPQLLSEQRGRLIDAYADAHKYVFGIKAVIYGEEDFVIAMAGFLDEIGMQVSMVVSGAGGDKMEAALKQALKNQESAPKIMKDTDFETMAEVARSMEPDILIGNSKGYYIARELKIPIVRVGFPIHDRIGGQRILHVGYAGTQQLFDRITNALLEYKQENSPIGYKYL